MPNAIMSKIEQHPVIASLILGGAGLGIALIFAKKAATAKNNAPGNVCTDAAGNPVDCNSGQPLSGASVSPALSNSDLATMLQDMEQQILNWEQQFGQQQNPPPNPTPTGSGICKGLLCSQGNTPIMDVNGCPICVPNGKKLVDTIRGRFNNSVVNSYDTHTPQGVPERETPGGKIVGYIPFGKRITDIVASAFGPSNFQHGNAAQQAQGSTIWYELTNGEWVSAWDFIANPSIPTATHNAAPIAGVHGNVSNLLAFRSGGV